MMGRLALASLIASAAGLCHRFGPNCQRYPPDADANQIMASIVQRRKLQVGLMLLLLLLLQLHLLLRIMQWERCSSNLSGGRCAFAIQTNRWPTTNCCRCDNRMELQL